MIDTIMTPGDRRAMIRAAHRRHTARAATVERVALRIEAQHAEPLELDVVGIVAEPNVHPRALAAWGVA